MPSPTTSISFLSIIFFINLCDGRSSMELIGLIGSQVLQSSSSSQTPPFSLPPFQSPPPLPQPLNNNMPPSFCPVFPPPSPALLPLIPTPQRNRPPPSPQLPEPGVPTAAPAPPIHTPTAPGKLEPPPLPPMVAPPPPTQQKGAPTYAVWCVAKPTVPEGLMQVAMDYACGSGADCKAIQVNGACYQPDTLLSHASFAFNSYFQNKKASGGTCDFGGTAMLVTVDPSFNGCHFIFI